MPPIAIYLNEEEVEMFKKFMQYRDAIEFMLKNGVFDMRNGNVMLSFDAKGDLKSLKREMFSYRHLTTN